MKDMKSMKLLKNGFRPNGPCFMCLSYLIRHPRHGAHEESRLMSLCPSFFPSCSSCFMVISFRFSLTSDLGPRAVLAVTQSSVLSPFSWVSVLSPVLSDLQHLRATLANSMQIEYVQDTKIGAAILSSRRRQGVDDAAKKGRQADSEEETKWQSDYGSQQPNRLKTLT